MGSIVHQISAVLVDRGNNWFQMSAFDPLYDFSGASALDPDFADLVWQPYLDLTQAALVPYGGITSGALLTADPFGVSLTAGYTYGLPASVLSGASFLSGSTFNDQTTFNMYVSAAVTDFPVLTSSVEYIPYKLEILSEIDTLTSKFLSAVFTDGTSIFNLEGSMNIYWTADPIDGFIEATSGTAGDDYNFITGAASAISAIRIFSDSTVPQFSYDISLSAVDKDGWRTPVSEGFIVNPGFQYNLTQTDVSASLSGVLLRDVETFIPGETQIVWTIDPIIGLSSTILTPDGPVALSDTIGPDAASSLDTLEIFATAFDQIYTFSLSGYPPDSVPFSDAKFFPYGLWDGSSSAHVRVTPFVQTGQIRFFETRVFGVCSDGTRHNFNPDYTIIWDNFIASDNVNATVDSITGDAYTFLVDGGSLTLMRDSNPLFVSLSTTIWDETGVPGVDSYVIDVTALSGYVVPDETLVILTTTLTSIEWVPDTFFDPIFAFNNELTSTTQIYRDPEATYTLTIRDSSIVPSPLTVEDFTIGIDVYPPSATISDFALVTGIPGVDGESICANVSASIAQAGWPDVSFKVATQKCVHFVSFFPNISDFIVYPEYKWDIGSTSFIKVTSDPVTLSDGVCAWGYCHTENFYLSAANLPANVVTYYWSVENVSPAPLGTTTNLVKQIPIPATATTSTHAVSLQVETSALPFTMNRFFYDDTTGVENQYRNFSDTSTSNDTRLKDDINRPSIVDFGSPSVILINNPLPVAIQTLSVSGGVVTPPDVPVSMGGINTFVWHISVEDHWEDTRTRVIKTYSPAAIDSLTVTDLPTADYTIAKFEPTFIDIGVTITTNFETKDPLFFDWCTGTQTFPTVTDVITAYPLQPFIYVTNKYVVTGDSVAYQNLVPDIYLISSWEWTDRGIVQGFSTTQNYVTSYSEDANINITLATVLTTAEFETNTFINVRVVLSEFITFDADINRVVGQGKLILPNLQNIVEVPPNEWVTSENFNRSFQKLEENIAYLDDQSQLYDAPPTEYIGWYGTYTAGGDTTTRWRVNISGLEFGYLNPGDAIDGVFNNLQDINVRSITGPDNDITLVSNSTAVIMLSGDFFGTEMSRVTQKGIGDDFGNIIAVDTDNDFITDSRVYLLDSLKNRVLVYLYNFTNNTWKLVYSWGGLGGASSRNKFRNPNDILVDSSNKVWVTDKNNLVVKKFSRTGGWITTLSSPFFKVTNKPLSTAIADDGTIHVLCEKSIVKFNTVGVSIAEYATDVIPALTPKTITTCRDGGFFYILGNSSAIKLSQIDGKSAGTFGDDFSLAGYRGFYHDAHRNAYFLTSNAIVKYVDKLDVLNLRLDTIGLTWPTSAFETNPDEYIQDWVVNKAISRYYDNLEVFRRSIIGKFDTTIRNGIEIAIIRTFTPVEYKLMPFSKKQIYVGFNEIVSRDVFNRCMRKLYACQEVLKDLIAD